MFNIEEIDKINKYIPKLEKKVRLFNLNKYEPTRKEIDSTYEHIKNFIKKKNRIVYGGWAQNAYIKNKKRNEQFYTDEDIPDIEIYTPEPVKDLMDLAEYLYDKKYKYIHTEEGVHIETYKLFVNFINYMDISYMPLNIYNNIITVKIDGMRMTHPHFMLVDAYRVYNDPVNSFWRLDKTFNRFIVLDKLYPIYDETIITKHFPISLYNKPKNTIKNKNYYDIHRWIRKKIIHNSKLIVIGYYGYQYYIKKTEYKKLLGFFPYYQLISTDYINDVKKIYQQLKKIYKNNISFKEFYPFYQFTGKNIMFFYNNNPILQIYDHNERCTVNRYSKKKKTYFGTTQLILMHFLIDYNYSIIFKTKNENSFKILFSNLVYARKKYLEKHNLSIVDVSPFQGFNTECFGYTIDTIRKSRLLQNKRAKQGKRRKFNYDPTGKKAKRPNIRFDNTSGNEITNKKNYTIKKK